MSGQPVMVHNAHPGQKENGDRQLEDQTESQQQPTGQGEIGAHGEHGLHTAIGAVGNQKPENLGEHPAETEPGAGTEAAATGQHERQGEAFLMAVHAGGDEQPQLPEKNRQAQQQTAKGRDF